MQAVLLSNGVLRSLPTSFSHAKSTIHEKKIADFSLHFPLRRGQHQWPISTIIRSEERRRRHPQQRRVSSKKPREGEGDELKLRSRPQDNKEILALFRRIQSSISKDGEAKVPRRRHGITDSDSLERRQSRERDKDKESRRGSGLEDAAALEDSNTVRSPFPVALPFDEQSLLKEDKVEKAQDVEGGKENMAVCDVFDNMKLLQLKEIARQRGIKGFSRLKKGELLILLKERLRGSS